jgi:hypothetical protein
MFIESFDRRKLSVTVLISISSLFSGNSLEASVPKLPHSRSGLGISLAGVPHSFPIPYAGMYSFCFQEGATTLQTAAVQVISDPPGTLSSTITRDSTCDIVGSELVGVRLGVQSTGNDCQGIASLNFQMKGQLLASVLVNISIPFRENAAYVKPLTILQASCTLESSKKDPPAQWSDIMLTTAKTLNTGTGLYGGYTEYRLQINGQTGSETFGGLPVTEVVNPVPLPNSCSLNGANATVKIDSANGLNDINGQSRFALVPCAIQSIQRLNIYSCFFPPIELDAKISGSGEQMMFSSKRSDLPNFVPPASSIVDPQIAYFPDIDPTKFSEAQILEGKDSKTCAEVSR